MNRKLSPLLMMILFVIAVSLSLFASGVSAQALMNYPGVITQARHINPAKPTIVITTRTGCGSCVAFEASINALFNPPPASDVILRQRWLDLGQHYNVLYIDGSLSTDGLTLNSWVDVKTGYVPRIEFFTGTPVRAPGEQIPSIRWIADIKVGNAAYPYYPVSVQSFVDIAYDALDVL